MQVGNTTPVLEYWRIPDHTETHALRRTQDDYKMSHAQKLQEIREYVATLPAADQLEINMWASELRDILDEGGQNAFVALAMTCAEMAVIAESQA